MLRLLGLLLLASSGAIAQSGPQASKIPPCVAACDPPAIASVNCTKGDQYCHCIHQDGILKNITVCSDKACENPSKDLYVFTELYGEVCAKFNISVPIVGSADGKNGSNVTYPPSQSTPTPVTNGGSTLDIIAILGFIPTIAITSGLLFCI